MPFAGRVFDQTGSYRIAFLAMLAALAIAAILNGFLKFDTQEAP